MKMCSYLYIRCFMSGSALEKIQLKANIPQCIFLIFLWVKIVQFSVKIPSNNRSVKIGEIEAVHYQSSFTGGFVGGEVMVVVWFLVGGFLFVCLFQNIGVYIFCLAWKAECVRLNFPYLAFSKGQIKTQNKMSHTNVVFGQWIACWHLELLFIARTLLSKTTWVL